MERVEEDVDAFIEGSPRRDDLRSLDAVIVAGLPRLTRSLWRGTMWGGTEQAIIGYGEITQPRPRGPGVEWFLVGLAAQKRHLSLYVNAAESGEYLARRWADRLGRVKIGAAAITFGAPADLDPTGLRAMLQRAVELSPDAR